MHRDPRRQHDTVLHVDRTVGKGCYQQLVPAGPEQKYLILQRQRRKMRDVFRPCYQLEQLFVRGVANVRHCILCIARDAELIGGAFRGTATRNHSTKISSQRRRFIQWPEKNWGQFPVRVRVAKSNIPIFI